MACTPIFIFGIARGGTNLIARMLDAHPQVAIALDPLMPLFKHFRNAVVRHTAPAAIASRFDSASSFQDFYGDADGPPLLDLMLVADLELPLAQDELAALRQSIAERASLESRDLPARLARLEGVTYAGLVSNALAIVADMLGGSSLRYAGVKEVWTIEFIPALARAFPNARFIIIERDPRAILASISAMARRDPSQAAHPISYLRHWRKNVVLARHFERAPELAGRLDLIKYEQLAAKPKEGIDAICRTLGLQFDSAMLTLEEATDHLTGGRWRGNSSYQAESGRITDASIARWREELPPAAITAVDFYCGPEMQLAGYAVSGKLTGSDEVVRYTVAAGTEPGKWRSDTGDLVADLGLEALRHHLLASPGDIPPDLARRCFLLPWVADEIVTVRRSLAR
jgi:hypothetical protein